MSAGFYKVNLIEAGLMYAPNFVYGPGVNLNKNDENKETMEVTEGWKWFDSDSEAYSFFEITPESQPWSVTPLQAKIALHNAGMLSIIETYMATADVPTKLAWETASEFRRDSNMLKSLANLLGMTDEQVNDLFAAAKLIEV